MLRLLVSPRWLALHVLVVVAAVACAVLGRWQLDVAEGARGGVRNLAYALQWWAFGLFAIFMWARILIDDRRALRSAIPAPATVEEPALTSPSRPARRDPADDEDPELVAYNSYLARLNARHQT